MQVKEDLGLMVYKPSMIAEQYKFVRELPNNRGRRVEAIQHWSGGDFGDSWCMEFATMVLDICFQGASLIDRQGSCETVYELAQARGWIAEIPSIDDLVISINSAGIAHHVGIVSNLKPLSSIAGNTSEDGISSNGDRVAEHEINPANKVFIHYPR